MLPWVTNHIFIRGKWMETSDWSPWASTFLVLTFPLNSPLKWLDTYVRVHSYKHCIYHPHFNVEPSTVFTWMMQKSPCKTGVKFSGDSRNISNVVLKLCLRSVVRPDTLLILICFIHVQPCTWHIRKSDVVISALCTWAAWSTEEIISSGLPVCAAHLRPTEKQKKKLKKKALGEKADFHVTKKSFLMLFALMLSTEVIWLENSLTL